MDPEDILPEQPKSFEGLSAALTPPQQEHPGKWCFAWLEAPPATDSADRAVLVKNSKWPAGSRISVSFLDGDANLQLKVMEAAQKWVAPGMANLVFDFRGDTNDTDIRISFQYAGSWSVLGTTCRRITDTAQPTMNFGWLTIDSPQEEIDRVVLHEFGHALGLTHEHLSPDLAIDWNRQQVEDDLAGPPNNWNAETIFNNMFRTFEAHETNFTKLDPDSIMMYPIPARWTNNGFSVGLNSHLSAKDVEFIRQQYP